MKTQSTPLRVVSALTGAAILTFFPHASAATLYWDSNGTGTAGAGATPTGTWGSSVFWTTDGTGANVDSPVLTATTTNADDLFFVAGPGAASGNNAYVVTVSGAQVAKSLTFQASGGTTLSGGTSITLGDGTAGAGGITMNQFAHGAVAQGAVTISTAISLANSQTWTNNSASTLSTTGTLNLGSNTLTFAGNGNFSFAVTGTSTISGTGGSIIKNGTGLLTLSAGGTAQAHTYTGTTTINGGTVMLGGSNKPTGNFNLTGGMLTDYTGGTYAFTGGLGTGNNQIQITGDSGFGGGNGTSTWRIGTTLSVLTWGGANFNPTTLKFQTAADNNGPSTYGIAVLDNGLDLGGASRTIDVLTASGTIPTTSGGRINGVISNGSLIKTGGGNLTLNSTANTYNGTTTISSGILTVGASGGLGDGSATNTLIFNGGTLRATGTVTSLSTRGVTMTQTGIIDSNAQAISIAGNIGGAGGLTKNNTGALTLSGTNNYGGVTTVNAGTLQFANEVSLVSNTAANLNVKSGATLALNVGGAGQFTATTINALLTNISVANTAASGLQAGAILGLDTTGGTFTQGNLIANSTGAFGGQFSLNKIGTGTLILDKANTYTGATTITTGTLQLDAGGSIAGSIINNSVYLVNQNATAGTAPLANIAGSGSIAAGPSATITINTATGLNFNALNTTGGGSFALSGVTTPTFGGLSGTTGNLSSAFSSGYSGVTNLTLNTAANNIAGNSFTYGGVIDNGAAGMSLTKTGAGTQTLTGTNTYTGTTFLNGGTLAIGSGSTIGKLSGTTDLNFNGGTLQFNRSTSANIDAINDAATITVNASSTFGVTSADAGGVNANESIGAVTLNAGQMNFNWTNGASSGAQMILSSLSRIGTASANFNGTLGTTGRWKVTSAGSTTAGQIIGPWYTTGGNNAGFASTDYAVFGSDFIAAANIAGSAETTWTTVANAYTMSANQTLTATRTITALRNTFATTPTLTLASGANLETYGLLNGANALFTVAPGTGGVLTTPTGGGNLYITAGANAIAVSAPINNNGGNVTLVKNGSNTLTLSSTTSNFSGGVVLNAGTLSFDDARSIGGTNNSGGSTASITVNGNSTILTVANTANANLGTGTITINDGATLTFAGTSRGIHTVGGAVTGSGGVTQTTGSFHGRLFLNSTANTFTGAITNSGSTTDGITAQFFSLNSIADGVGYGNMILNAANDNGFDYGSGALAALNLNNRQLVLANNNTVFFNNASSQAVNINTDIGFSGTGARQIRFGISGRSGAGISTFAGKLTDNVGGAFTPTVNGGTWVFTNSNTYSGTTTVSGVSTLQIGSNSVGSVGAITSSAIGTGGLTLGGGALSSNSTTARTILNSVTFTGNATLGNATNTGKLTFSADAALGGATRTITLNSDAEFAGIVSSSGAFGITKAGAGTLSLSNTNTYTGVTTISAGVLEASVLANGGSNSSIGASANTATNFSLGNGTTFRYVGSSDVTTNRGFQINGTAAGHGATIESSGTGTLSFDNTVAINWGTNNQTRTLTIGGANSGINTLGKVIVNNGTGATSLVKASTGTWALTQVNTYTGSTQINGGTLNVSVGSINSTSAINVAAGGTLRYNSSTALTVAPTLAGAGISSRAVLGGTGTINVAITLDNLGDVLSPGNSPGVQTYTPAQNWASFSYDWETNNFTGTTAGTDFDQIAISNTLNLSGGSGAYILNVISLDAGNVGGNAPNFTEINRTWNVITSNNLTGFNAANWTVNTANFTNPDAGTWSLSQSGNNVVLSYTAVPEPRAALLGCLGVLLLLRRRR